MRITNFIACGGNTIGGLATNQCWIYRYQSWLPELEMSIPRSNAAATVINDGRHDLIYWVTFGKDDTGNDLSSSEFLPWYVYLLVLRLCKAKS